MTRMDDYMRELGSSWDEEPNDSELAAQQFESMVDNCRAFMLNGDITLEKLSSDRELWNAIASGFSEGSGFPRMFMFGITMAIACLEKGE